MTFLVIPLDPQPPRGQWVRARGRNDHVLFEGLENMRTGKPLSDFVFSTYYANPTASADCPLGRMAEVISHEGRPHIIQVVRALRLKDISRDIRPRLKGNPWCWVLTLQLLSAPTKKPKSYSVELFPPQRARRKRS